MLPNLILDALWFYEVNYILLIIQSTTHTLKMYWESVLILHAHLLIFASFSTAHFLSFLPSCPLCFLLPSYPPTFPSLSLSSFSYLPSLFASFSLPPLSPLFPYLAPPNCIPYLIPFSPSTSPPLPYLHHTYTHMYTDTHTYTCAYTDTHTDTHT